MSRRSFPVCLSWLPRPLVLESLRYVRDHGGDAPGPDGRSKEEALGEGPGCPREIAALKRLNKRKHGYRFGEARLAQLRDPATGKVRGISLLDFDARVIVRSKHTIVAGHLPCFSVNACRNPRSSAARVAFALSTSPGAISARVDLADAFDSIDVERVLDEVARKLLPQEMVDALRGMSKHYGPGAPAGIATSPLILDMACLELDRALVNTEAIVAFRYADDVIIVGRKPGLREQMVELVEKTAGRFNLRCHPTKTGAYSNRPMADERSYPVPWLGYSISPGRIDIRNKTVAKILRLDREGQVAALHQFKLAQGAPNYEGINAND